MYIGSKVHGSSSFNADRESAFNEDMILKIQSVRGSTTYSPRRMIIHGFMLLLISMNHVDVFLNFFLLSLKLT